MALSGWNPDNKITLMMEAQLSELVDFAVLVNLTGASGTDSTDCTAVFDELGDDKFKIAVEFGDTGTQCFVEIESWDSVNESAQLWVKVPSLSDIAVTTLYLYYDSTHADNTTVASTYLDNVVLAMPMNGPADSNRFYDLKGHPVTTYGNTKIVASPAKFGSSVAYFDGSDDYLALPFSTDFVFTGTAWTIEAWIYLTTLPSSMATIFSAFSNSSSTGVRLLVGPAGALYAGVGSPDLNSADGAIAPNTWYHVAVCGSGSNVKLFVDGTVVASVTTAATTPTGISYVYVGSTDGSNWMLTGYIEDLRISKGLARYTANFTVPTESYLDKSATVVALPMAGPNNATTFSDIVGRAVTAYGNAKISSTQSKFNGTSAYFDGSGDYLAIPYSPEIDLLGHDFTVEAWVYPTFTPTSYDRRLCGSGGGTIGWNSSTGLHWLIQFSNSNPPALAFQFWNGSAADGYETTAKVSLNAWSHVAISVDATSRTLYISINGTVQSFSLTSIARPSSNPGLAIATLPGEGGDSAAAYTGYLDDFRITRGEAKYKTNFTPLAESVFGFVGTIGSVLAQQVWDENYVTVYHFGQNPSVGTIYDSTANKQNLTTTTGMVLVDGPTGFDSPIGKALYFYGLNAYVTSVSKDLTALQTAFTLEATLNFLSAGAYRKILNVGPTLSGPIVLDTFSTSGFLNAGILGDDLESTVPISADFNTYGLLLSGGSLQGLNGGSRDSVTNAVTVGSLVSSTINMGPGATGGYYDFIIRTFKLSKVARSEDWTIASNATEFDQFITYEVPASDITCDGSFEQALPELSGVVLVILNGSFIAPTTLIEGAANSAVVGGTFEPVLAEIVSYATAHIGSWANIYQPKAIVTSLAGVPVTGDIVAFIPSVSGLATLGTVCFGDVDPIKPGIHGNAQATLLNNIANFSPKLPTLEGQTVFFEVNSGHVNTRLEEIKAKATIGIQGYASVVQPKARIKGLAIASLVSWCSYDSTLCSIKGYRANLALLDGDYSNKICYISGYSFIGATCQGNYAVKKPSYEATGTTINTGVANFVPRIMSVGAHGQIQAQGVGSFSTKVPVVKATRQIQQFNTCLFSPKQTILYGIAYAEFSCDGSLRPSKPAVKASTLRTSLGVLKFEQDNSYLRAPEESLIDDILSY